ncbi:MAG: response regulator [Geobacteraceae bacterium]|nr:response regulator [Geobacteraceae bacterium]NTW79865.1 response regulator [Geobacteraceae bacterium]
MKQARYITKRSFAFLLIVLTGICALVFNLIYENAKESAINNLNNEQLIHAKQAAHGIEEYFATWTGILKSLSRMNEIISVDANGKHQMQLFYDAHKDQIRSFTRMNEDGIILFTVPNRESIGSNLAHQKHVQELFKTQKPVISDVFMTVQGFNAVALHVPVFKGEQFKGSIAIIINFQSLAKRYLEIIRIGKTGYAWVVSRDGTELYCPVPGHTGNSVFTNCKEFPSIIAMADYMLKGHSGNTTYTFNMISNTKITPVTKHAVYQPINLGNTFWSIVVASSEDEVLSSLSSYRNRLVLVMGLTLIGLIIIAGMGVKALLIVKEENVRTHAEEELRANELRYRHLFEQNPAIMLIYAKESLQMLAVNEAFLLNYGYSNEEALALQLTDLYPAEEQARLKEVTAKISGYSNVGEWHHCRKDGSRLSIVATSNDISYQGINARIAVITDITERKQLEEQLHQAQKMESIGRLAGGVAHDFNNMLGVIIGSTELAMHKLPEDSPVQKYLEHTFKAAQRSSEITHQLLAFSRKEIISPKPVNMNSMIIESEKMLVRLISEDIKLIFKPGSGLWTVLFDPSQMDQILMNLSVNGRDAMPNGGSLLIETANIHIGSDFKLHHQDARPGDYVLLTVSDTGCGMSSETREHIFEPFFTTKGTGKGTGLGLATVYGIVTQNNGFISCDSEPDHGTVFKIFLPRLIDVDETITDEVKPEIQAGTGTIILVEDETMLLLTTTEMLKVIGYTVIQAKSPEEAIAICENRDLHIDLILTDVIMPGMNGREMAEKIKTFRPEIKVLFISGYAADFVAERGVVEKGMQFIQKPLNIQQLNDKIKYVLGLE